MRSILIRPGTQDHVNGVWIGIMRLAEVDGVRWAQLMLQSDRESRIVPLRVGDSVEAFGTIRLTFSDVVSLEGESQPVVELKVEGPDRPAGLSRQAEDTYAALFDDSSDDGKVSGE